MNDAITRLPGSDFDQRWKDVAHRWARHADHVRLAQVREEETVQIGRGNCEWQSVWAYGLDTLLTHAACSVAVSARLVPHPDWIAILAPTHVTSVLRINGCEVGPEDIYLSTTANGHCITGQRRSGFALGLRRARLAGACAALAGIAEDDLVIRDLEMSLGRDGAAHLHALFWAAILLIHRPCRSFALRRVSENGGCANASSTCMVHHPPSIF